MLCFFVLGCISLYLLHGRILQKKSRTRICVKLHLVLYIFYAMFINNIYATETDVSPEKAKLERTSGVTTVDIKISVKDKKYLYLKDKIEKILNEIKESEMWNNDSNQSEYMANYFLKYIARFLEYEGYYDSIIESEIIQDKKSHRILNFAIEPGERYKISKITLVRKNNLQDNITLPSMDMLSSKAKEFVSVEKILGDVSRIEKFIEENNCILDANVSHTANIDHQTNSIILEYQIRTGDVCNIEAVEFIGLKTVRESHALKIVDLKEDSCYKKSIIIQAQNNLQASMLFSTISALSPEHAKDNGKTPVVFVVKERKHKTFKAGLSYTTDLGSGLSIGWQNRNFKGSAENLTTNFTGNKREQKANIGYDIPFFHSKSQNLKFDFNAENQRNRSYNSQEISNTILVERKFTKTFTANAGLKYSIGKVQEQDPDSKYRYSLISMPVFAVTNRQNDLLDAHKGYVVSASLEPFWDTTGRGRNFIKTYISTKGYINVYSKFNSVLAMKVSVGMAQSKKHVVIPAPERFFLGGSGSLRGYKHQSVGLLSPNKKIAMGGQSIFITSLEYRTKPWEHVGLVAFVDSGMNYKKSTPNFRSKLLHGAGIGIRYSTDFGPLRFDIAFPVSVKRKFYNRYQLYFGIGQSF